MKAKGSKIAFDTLDRPRDKHNNYAGIALGIIGGFVMLA